MQNRFISIYNIKTNRNKTKNWWFRIPRGTFLIKWDTIEGGIVSTKYPDDLEIPINVVQQIQISHDFIESNITIQEKDWNSISHYNEEKSIIIVLVLDKFDDPSDYIVVLEEFNSFLEKDMNEEDQKVQLEQIFEFSKTVFRTRDEVISKLSNEVAELKMYEYDLKRRYEMIVNTDFMGVKGQILYLLTFAKEELSFNELRRLVKTSKRWLQSTLDILMKNEIISYSHERDGYYLNI